MSPPKHKKYIIEQMLIKMGQVCSEGFLGGINNSNKVVHLQLEPNKHNSKNITTEKFSQPGWLSKSKVARPDILAILANSCVDGMVNPTSFMT